LNSAISGPAVDLRASSLQMNSITGSATAGILSITSPLDSGLAVSGTGTLAATGGITFTANIPALVFSTTSLTLNDTTTMNAVDGIVTIKQGANVTAGSVTVNACQIAESGTFIHGTLTFNVSPNCPSGVGCGTLTNPVGDLVLSQNLLVNCHGKDVT